MKRDNLPVCEHHEVHRELVAEHKADMPKTVVLYDLSDFFKIMGDSTRLGILFAIDKEPLCVCDIAAVLSMTQPAVSYQLKVLKQAKLVKPRRAGKTIFYSLADSHVETIIGMAKEHLEE